MFFKHAKTDLTLLDHGNLRDLMASKEVPREVINRLGSLTPVANYLDDYVYIRHRAISAREHYGPNGNHDSFPQKDLQRATPTFINTGFYKDHQNWDKSLAYGINLDAYYHPKHFVVLLSAVSRKFKPDSPETVANILANKWNQTSMGAAVGWSECSHCANKAHSPEEYCNHIRFAKGQMIDGKIVEEINHDFEFFEDSLITTEAADRDARIAEVYLPEEMLKAASLQPELLRGDFTDYIRMPHVKLARLMQQAQASRAQNGDTTNAPKAGGTDIITEVKGGSVSRPTTAADGSTPAESASGLPANAPTPAMKDIKDLTRTQPTEALLPGKAPAADPTNTATPDQISQVPDNADYALAAKQLAAAAKTLEGLSMSKPKTASVEDTVPLMIATQHGMQAGEVAQALLKGKAGDVDSGMVGQIKSYISSIPMQNDSVRDQVGKMLATIKAFEKEHGSTSPAPVEAPTEAPMEGSAPVMDEGTGDEIATAAGKGNIKNLLKNKKDKDKKPKKNKKKGMLGRLANLLMTAADDEADEADDEDDSDDDSSEDTGGADGASVEGLKSDLKQVQQEINTAVDMIDTEKDKVLARKKKATLGSMKKRAEEELEQLQSAETNLVEVKHEVEEMIAGVNEGDIPSAKDVEKAMEEVREIIDENAGGVDKEGRLKAMALAYTPSFVGRRLGRKVKADESDKEPSGGPEAPKDGNMEQMIDRGDVYSRDPWAEWQRTFQSQESGTRSDIDKQRNIGFATPEEQIKQRDLTLASLSSTSQKLVAQARSTYIKLRTAGTSHIDAMASIDASLTRMGIEAQEKVSIKVAAGLAAKKEDEDEKDEKKDKKKSKASVSEKVARLSDAIVSRYSNLRRLGATHTEALSIVSNDMENLGVPAEQQEEALEVSQLTQAKKDDKDEKAKKDKEKDKEKNASLQERNAVLRAQANDKYNLLRSAGISHEAALDLVKADLLKQAQDPAMAAPGAGAPPADPAMGAPAGAPGAGGMNEDAMDQIVQRTADELADRIFEANPATPENQGAAAQTGMPPTGASENAAAFGIPPVMVSSLRDGRPSMDSGFEPTADLNPGVGGGSIKSDESPAPNTKFPDDPSDPAWDLFPEDQISGVVRESNSEQEAQLKQDLKGVYTPSVAPQKQISPRTIYPNAGKPSTAGRSTEDSDEKALLSLQLAQSEVDAGLVPQADLEQEAQRLFRMNPDQLKGVEATLQKVAARRFPHPDSGKDIVTQAMNFGTGFGGSDVEAEENLFDE